jgi:glycosyltransferase involved in cell wall biosynthesis
MGTALKIAYLTSVYPRATDTFIRNEVFGLRALGYEISTFSIRKVDASQLVNDQVRQEFANTTYIVPDRVWATPRAVLRALFRSPARFGRALGLAWRARPPGLEAFALQIAYFLEACVLAQCLQELGIDHLHNHIGQNSASVAMLCSELSGIPFSLTIHGSYVFRAPERWALGEKVARSVFTACISEFTRSQCMIYTPYSRWQRLHVVHCVPEPEFLRSEPSPVADAPRFLWVGRMCEEKGISVLIGAAQRLAQEGHSFELVLVGDGPLRAQIEAQVREGGIADRTIFRGWSSTDEIREEIEAARVLVIASFAEGLPIVLLEAFALRRPVIATYLGGIPELVQDGRNGWLVPAGSEPALARAMREALEATSADLQAMGNAGRAAVNERHSPAVEVGKLARLIEEAHR